MATRARSLALGAAAAAAAIVLARLYARRRARAQTPAQRWAARLSASGIGYATSWIPIFERPTPQRSQDAAAAAEARAAADAIGACLERARLPFERIFQPAGRTRCPGCGRTRRWFCNRCLRWLPPISPPPPFALPFRLEILVRDDVDRATGIHAAALATPVGVRRFPEGLADGVAYDPSTTVVLYPSAGALTVDELLQHFEPPAAAAAAAAAAAPPRPPLSSLVVVVPDTKWNNDGAVLAHPSLRGLRHLSLRSPPAESAIWRSNARATSGCVSTIEAIYCVVREMRRAVLAASREGGGGDGGDGGDGGEEQLLLLFGVTRHLIASQRSSAPPPFTEEYKAMLRKHRHAAAAAGTKSKAPG